MDIKHGARSEISEDQDTAIAEPTKLIQFKRHFTEAGKDPFDTVEWAKRDAKAGDFFQADVEFPTSWSDSAVGIVSKLYFATIDGVRESSLKTLIERVVIKICNEGVRHQYFGDIDEMDKRNDLSQIFYDELIYILLHQFAAFNSPVWFNFGVPGRKQCASACFLLNVEDKLLGPESISEWISTESAIFKNGAGSGVNLSKLRGSMEPLSSGGISSGPVSFIRSADANSGSIKSGGTRRAAKLVQLDVDHPDILDFIDSKVREDERMKILRENGVNLDPATKEGEKNIAECTSFQNANITVRLSDKFMKAVENSKFWHGELRTGKGNTPTLGAKVLLERIAEAAWKCADPGVAFDDTINSWHTTPSLGKIETSNPCFEVHTNNNSSCNLASINLVKFLVEDQFAFNDFNQVVDIMITAMDITCSFSELPTPKLEENTRNLRQLGLGYSNLGAALMIQGMPYDSDEARDWAASVTSLMTGRAYRRSAEMASILGPFLHYEDNEELMEKVLQKHVKNLPKNELTEEQKLDLIGHSENLTIWEHSNLNWGVVFANRNGFRNSQVTVLAPTGTISFMMDCDTTGCEPAYSLVTYKSLAGGGHMTLVNNSVARSLETQGFLKHEIEKIEEEGLIHPIFSSPQFQTAAGENPISPEGHLKMVAAIQPHISGASSKTINLPEDTTVQDIYDIYMKAWKMGLKCVSVYRDGSKATQVLSTKKSDDKTQSDKRVEDYVEAGELPPDIAYIDGEKEAIRLADRDIIKSRLEKSQNSTTEKNSDFVAQRLDTKLDIIEDIGKNEDEAFKELEDRCEDIHIYGQASDIPKDLNKDISNEKLEELKLMKDFSKNGRKKIPNERTSLTHKFQIADHEGYITAGMYEDGTLGEIFLSGIGKEGSTLRGMMDAWAISVSMGLQWGVPLEDFARKFSHMRFDPEGLTNNPEIRTAKSMVDYIMRWLVSKFGSEDLCEELGVMTKNVKKKYTLKEKNRFNTQKVLSEITNGILDKANIEYENHISKDYTNVCICGGLLVRTGTCYSCSSCGSTSGCG